MAVLLLGPASSVSLGAEVGMPSVNIPELDPKGALAVTGFSGAAGQLLADIVANDLGHAGLFTEVQEPTNAPPVLDINRLPDFAAAKTAGVRYLLIGTTIDLPDNRATVKIRFWDVDRQSQLAGLQFTSTHDSSRRIGHLIADAVMQRVTQHAGYFNTRVAYISAPDRTPGSPTRLAVMDLDGSNSVFLTTGKYRAADPVFFPSGDMLAYTSELDGQERVYLFSLTAGKQKRIGHFSAPTRMPALSSDGNSMALICEEDGHANICLVDIASEQVIRKLSHNAVDAFPSFSPDGQFLVFQSNRDGEPGIFIADTHGKTVRRLGNTRDSLEMPAWSPDGRHIAVTRYTGSGSRIAVMDVDGSNLHDVSAGTRDTRPQWAHNGSALLFTRSDPADSLWVVNSDGASERKIRVSAAAKDASWSGDIR